LKITSDHRSIGLPNIFTFEFTTRAEVKKYPLSKIWLEFPTKDKYGDVFDSKLGYAKDGETVGCWFEPTIFGTELACRLIQAPA